MSNKLFNNRYNKPAALTECQGAQFKSAGYDFYVSYKEWKEDLGIYLSAGFPTTRDTLSTHLAAIKNRDTVELEITEL